MTSIQGPTRPGDPTFIDASPGDEVPKNVPIFLEIGRSGLKRVSGYVDDEFLPQLRGRKAVKIYREISDNSSVIGAFLMAVRLLLRQLEWRVEPASSSAEDQANAQFVEECMHDMEAPWGEIVYEMANFLVYGWSLHEPVYKRRIGPWEKDPKRISKFSDGRIGWRKMPGRAQETMWRWVFDDFGDIQAMVQMAPPKYQKVVIPLQRCLLFRTTIEKNNPEGRSLLRNSYVSWFFLKRFQEIEATGVARDLAGMPIAKVPPKLFSAAKGSQDAKMLAAVTTLVQKVNRNENEGIVWPWLIDEESKQPLYDFSLLTSGGSRQFDTESIINRYKLEMLQSMLADFMEVGHENNGGSYALHTDKSGLFRTALNAFAKQIADTINRHGLTRLFALNGMRPAQLPKIKPNDVDPPALDELGAFINALVGAGMSLFPDPTLEAFIRDAARLPKLDPQVEAIHLTEQHQGALLDLVNQRLQMLQAEQAAQTGQAQMAQAQLGVANQAAGALASADELENPQQNTPARQPARTGRTRAQPAQGPPEQGPPARQGPPLRRPPR